MTTGAGWHGDPWGRAEWRWFDGVEWTDHVLRDGVSSIDPAQGEVLSGFRAEGPTWSPPIPVLPAPAAYSPWHRFRRRSMPVQIAAWGAAVFASVVVIGIIGSIGSPKREQSVVSLSTSVPSSAAAPSTEIPTTMAALPSPAGGDVARCKDGTFSANTKFSATCSSHEGIEVWLAPYGRCTDGTIVAMSEDTDCGDHDGFESLLSADFVPSATTEDVARCKDGLFSDNSDFSETCSSHGGVDGWLATYGACTDGTTITMGESSSCDDHGRFAGLMPVDFVPPTTTLPQATTTAPITLLTPCTELQERAGGFVCAPTGFGPLWIDAPFSEDSDQVVMLPADVAAGSALVVNDMGVIAAGFQELQSFGQKYWCVSVGLKNLAGAEQSYNMFDFKLLTPSGSLQSPTVPLANDLSFVLTAGGLASGGTVSGGVCFDQPATVTGKFALVYQSFSLFGSERALYFFDH